MKLVITGGAGYIGTELLSVLDESITSFDIVVYDNLSRGNYNLFLSEKIKSKSIQFVQGDILDTRKLRAVLADADAVVHLAAKVTTPFANEDPHLFEQVNHWGSAELSYALEGSNVKKLIYLSSLSVYGTSNEWVNFDSVPNPKTYYGISKLNGERMLTATNPQIDKYVLRCGNVYGYSKSMRFDAVVNKFMFNAHFNHTISIQGNGEQVRSFIHIDNVVSVLKGILFENNLEPSTYLLTDKNISIRELGETLKQLYPFLDMIYVQQDLQLKSIKVHADCMELLSGLYEKLELIDELTHFKNKFSFNTSENHILN